MHKNMSHKTYIKCYASCCADCVEWEMINKMNYSIGGKELLLFCYHYGVKVIEGLGVQVVRVHNLFLEEFFTDRLSSSFGA